jgi:hypothetical protein
MSNLTSLILHLSLPLSPMDYGRVLRPAVMLKGLSATPRKASGFDHSYSQRSYSLNTPYVSTFNAALTNEPYSKSSEISIHVNPYFMLL